MQPLTSPKPQEARSSPFDALFSPRSIAVIGASPAPGNLGARMLRNLLKHGYRGEVHAVNLAGESVDGVPGHRSVLDIPGEVDLGLVVVPARVVPEVADECGRKGVGGLVVISAGFREAGPAGLALERELERVVERHAMRMVGPNCAGVVNAHPDVRMNASLADVEVPYGRMAFMSQSGALGIAVLSYASRLGIGMSKFASLGNKTNVSSNDLLEAWADDPEAGVLVLYLEDFGNPRKFARIVHSLAREKPVLAVKSGRTPVGARAATSHTGALAERDVATEALLEEAGITRAKTLEELLDVALAFSLQPFPRGRRVAIVTNSGGPAIMAADALVEADFELADLGEAAKRKLRTALPPAASVENPVDLIASGGPREFRFAIETILKEDAVDAVLAIYTPPLDAPLREVGEAIAEAASRSGRTVLGVVVGEEPGSPGARALVGGGVPAYAFPEDAVRVLAHMRDRVRFLQRPRGQVVRFEFDEPRIREVLGRALDEGREHLMASEALLVLEAAGVPVAPFEVVGSPLEVGEAARRLGLPVAVKAEARDLVHKTEVGAVRLDLATPGDATRAAEDLAAALPQRGYRPGGFLVQKMARKGRETIVGSVADPKFGPLLTFGLGGIYVEVMKHVAFRLAPIEDREAERMVRSIPAAGVLTGVRGEPPADLRALTETVQRVGQLALDYPEIQELDVNPLIAYPEEEGALAVDARIRVAKPFEPPIPGPPGPNEA